jgi:D-3-phosphoglycerate dehydrogenase
MTPTAFIVNTSRGGLIDEAALAAAITGGRLAGAGLDVLDREPPPADHPLLALDRVILSPHSASLTEECTERMAISAAENVLAGLDRRLDPSLVANPSVLGPSVLGIDTTTA